MKIRALPVCLVSVFLLVMLVPSLRADWAGGGIELCTYPAEQSEQAICSDCAGGAIVVWQDEREGTDTWDIYAQRFDADGNILWDDGGVNVSELAMSQWAPVIVSDGAGGAIVVYLNDRMGSYDITAQRIRPDGARAWGTGGLTVCGASNDQQGLCIVSSGSGGAIVAWEDFRNSNWDIFAAKIDSTGSMPWSHNGEPACMFSGDQNLPAITTEGSGGAIIAWEDSRSGNHDIYAQKINFLGSRVWLSTGNPVAINTGEQQNARIVSDMAGGAVISWEHDADDILAGRLLSDGTGVWNPGSGIWVCIADEAQYWHETVSDGAGGAIIAWCDNRNGTSDIYAHHIDFAGGSAWPLNGTKICGEEAPQAYLDILSDKAGGAYILWTDTRYFSNYEIFGQHIDVGGTMHWPINGRNLTSWPASQIYSEAIETDDGFIATWVDHRDFSNPQKIYAQKFDKHGYWGDPAPVIYSASDVPSDQGGQVLLEWWPIRMDEFPYEIVTHYTVWRSISEPTAMAMIQEGTERVSPGEIGLDFAGKAYRDDIVFGAATAWEWVATIEAQYWDEYAYSCGTLYDHVEGVWDGTQFFVVTANTFDPFTFWNSEPVNAYSVDDLAPCAPMDLAGEQSYAPEGLALSWSPNSEADLGGYIIYRGSDPAFEPSEDNMLTNTCDTLVLDGGWSWDSGYCYKVAAVDIHGNESDYAVLCIEQVTGDDPMPLPDATFLAQNYPNPFNPNTTIAFGLKAGGFVNLSVYDAAGRLVAILINESRPAGQYTTIWNGNTENGSSAASGVYFYKLVTEEFAKTRKMILLR